MIGPRTLAVVEETETLLGYGWGPFDIAEALKLKIDSLAMSLQRGNRPDLAELVRDARHADRKRLGEAKGTWREARDG